MNGCETCLKLEEEYKLMVFEKELLRKMPYFFDSKTPSIVRHALDLEIGFSGKKYVYYNWNSQYLKHKRSLY